VGVVEVEGVAGVVEVEEVAEVVWAP